jgi:hypothetical protein
MSAFPYRTQAVRDLAWACFSPTLLHSRQMADDGENVDDCGLALTPARLQWLTQLDCEPEPLLEHLSRKPSTRLGIYFERLWHFFLEQDPGTELLAHNLPVRDHGRTLGEFDVIYWCHQRRRHFHLELAVKFYLGWRQQTSCEPASLWREWLGPNSRDRLDLKLEQMLQRQIRLGRHPLAREQLAALGIPDMAQEIAIKGYLFQSLCDPLPPPFGHNPRSPLRHWLPVGALRLQLRNLPAERFLELSKELWLAPVQINDEGDLLSRSALDERLQSQLTSQPRSRLIAGVDGAGLELCRFFVTANDWPANAEDYQNKEKL